MNTETQKHTPGPWGWKLIQPITHIGLLRDRDNRKWGVLVEMSGNDPYEPNITRVRYINYDRGIEVLESDSLADVPDRFNNEWEIEDLRVECEKAWWEHTGVGTCTREEKHPLPNDL